MPQPPYVKILVRVDGGPPQTGGVEVSGGNTIKLALENTIAIKDIRWEVYGFPIGYATPTGWTLDADSRKLFSTDLEPADLPIPPTASLWGKWLVDVYANGDRLSERGVTGIQTLSPVLNLYATAPGEGDQFGGYALAVESNWHILDASSGSGGGGGPTTLAGDVTGSSGANTVVKVRGKALGTSIATPTLGQFVTYTSASEYGLSPTPTALGQVSYWLPANGNWALTNTPSNGQVLLFTGGLPTWSALPSGDAISLRGVTLATATATPALGQMLSYSSTGTQWVLTPAPTGTGQFSSWSGTAWVMSATPGTAGHSPVWSGTAWTVGLTNASQIQGVTVLSTAPTAGQALIYNNGTSRWEPTTLPAPTFAQVQTALAAASGAVGVNSQKITALASGTVATDAVNKGQLDSVSSAIPAASATTPAAVGTAGVVGVATPYARQDHVHALSEATVRSVVAGLTAALAVNNQKITSLADGTVSTDAATFGQLQAVQAGQRVVDMTGLSGTYTLSAAEQSCTVLILSGTPSGDLDILWPTLQGRTWTVLHQGASATWQRLVQLRTSGGARPVPILPGGVRRVSCDGAELYADDGRALVGEVVIPLAGTAGSDTDYLIKLPAGTLLRPVLARGLVTPTGSGVAQLQVGTTVGGQEILNSLGAPAAGALIGDNSSVHWGNSLKTLNYEGGVYFSAAQLLYIRNSVRTFAVTGGSSRVLLSAVYP